MDIHESSYQIDNVKVELEHIGEGFFGDYNEEDSKDVPLLRFYISGLIDGNWEELDDCSYCTRIPATAKQEIVDAAARFICKEYSAALKSRGMDNPPKKLGAELSWLSEDDFSDIAEEE